MAPKRSTPLEAPPAASSSQEEESSSGEEDDGEEEEGSSSEEEENQGKPQKPSSQPASQIQTAKPVHKKPDSESESDESDSESDSDDDRPNHARDATVKPIASKPMEETPTKTTKPRSKPSASSPATAKATAAVKRASESDRDLKDSKRRKKKDSESDGVVEKSEDTKKQLFQRLWSEDDEIAVLKGIIDFTKKKGTDPSKDMTSFHDFIKKSLHFDVSLSQLKDKVWRLKKKFENHVSKGKKGENKTFSKAHDQKSFDLSKKIWGSEAISGRGVDLGVKSNGKAKMNGGNNQRSKSFDTLNAEQCLDVEKETEKVDKMEVETESHSGLKQIVEFDRTASVAGMEEYVLKRGPDMLEGAKKAEMEEKWRQLHVAELELFLKRNELIREQAKLMLAAYKTE